MNKKKIVVCPDSFKGTMSSLDVAEIIATEIYLNLSDAEVYTVPIADGGEGTLECYRRAVAGRMVGIQTRNSNFKPVGGEYYLTRDNAIIESAKVIGLFQTEDKNPMRTTSYGVGKLIEDALKRTRNIVLTLGGSSTNDGGTGIAAALGARFLDNDGKEFIPTGATLINIDKIDASALPQINLTCMCDVNNPLYGKTGAAYVFAPQKGASPKTVQLLDEGLVHLSKIIKRDLGVDVSAIEGGGAAGGIAAGMVAFFGAKLKSGIETMLDTIHFDDIISDSIMIFTGEGRLDSQTMKGKAIDGIVKRAKKYDIPVIAICGQIEMGFDLKSSGLALAIATGRAGEALDSNHDYKADLKNTTAALIKKLSGK